MKRSKSYSILQMSLSDVAAYSTVYEDGYHLSSDAMRALCAPMIKKVSVSNSVEKIMEDAAISIPYCAALRQIYLIEKEEELARKYKAAIAEYRSENAAQDSGENEKAAAARQNKYEEHKKLLRNAEKGPDKKYYLKKLIYIDMANVTEGDGYIEKILSGISISFSENEEEDTVRFIPFERSASQQRQNIMILIREDLYGSGSEEDTEDVEVADPKHKGKTITEKRYVKFDETETELSRRMRCGLPRIPKVVTSKYAAYRALMLTQGVCIDDTYVKYDDGSERELLNEKSIIVVDDYTVRSWLNLLKRREDKDLVTSRDLSDYESVDTRVVKSEESEKQVMELKDFAGKSDRKYINDLLFDGEGLISKEVGELFERKIGARASSFQIRMPFVKGVVHKVDIKSIFHRIFGERYNEISICDEFGKYYKLSEVEMILTNSMFKMGKKYREVFSEFYSGLKPKFQKNRYMAKDVFKYYWHHFKKGEHRIFISGCDEIFRSDDSDPMRKLPYTVLNYQFLSTLDEDTNTAGSNLNSDIIAPSANALHITQRNTYSQAVSFMLRSNVFDEENGEIIQNTGLKNGEKSDDDTSAEVTQDENDFDENSSEENVSAAAETQIVLKNRKNMAEFFLKNPRMVKTAAFSDKVTTNSLNDEFSKGRLIIMGTMRYLSGDLLQLVTLIAYSIILNKSIRKKLQLTDEEVNAQRDELDKFVKEVLEFRDRYYAPAAQQPHEFAVDTKNDKLLDDASEGENVELRRLAVIDRNPHLSKNEHVVLSPYMAKAGETSLRDEYFGSLTGVLMLPVDEKRYVQRLGGADYDGDIVRLYLSPEYVRAAYSAKKTRPLLIPSEKAKEEYYTTEECQKLVKRSSGSQVGKFSNDAFKTSLFAYGHRKGGEIILSDDLREVIKYCLKGTIFASGKAAWDEATVKKAVADICDGVYSTRISFEEAFEDIKNNYNDKDTIAKKVSARLLIRTGRSKLKPIESTVLHDVINKGLQNYLTSLNDESIAKLVAEIGDGVYKDELPYLCDETLEEVIIKAFNDNTESTPDVNDRIINAVKSAFDRTNTVGFIRNIGKKYSQKIVNDKEKIEDLAKGIKNDYIRNDSNNKAKLIARSEFEEPITAAVKCVFDELKSSPKSEEDIVNKTAAKLASFTGRDSVSTKETKEIAKSIAVGFAAYMTDMTKGVDRIDVLLKNAYALFDFEKAIVPINKTDFSKLLEQALMDSHSEHQDSGVEKVCTFVYHRIAAEVSREDLIKLACMVGLEIDSVKTGLPLKYNSEHFTTKKYEKFCEGRKKGIDRLHMTSFLMFKDMIKKKQTNNKKDKDSKPDFSGFDEKYGKYSLVEYLPYIFKSDAIETPKGNNSTPGSNKWYDVCRDKHKDDPVKNELEFTANELPDMYMYELIEGLDTAKITLDKRFWSAFIAALTYNKGNTDFVPEKREEGKRLVALRTILVKQFGIFGGYELTEKFSKLRTYFTSEEDVLTIIFRLLPWRHLTDREQRVSLMKRVCASHGILLTEAEFEKFGDICGAFELTIPEHCMLAKLLLENAPGADPKSTLKSITVNGSNVTLYDVVEAILPSTKRKHESETEALFDLWKKLHEYDRKTLQAVADTLYNEPEYDIMRDKPSADHPELTRESFYRDYVFKGIKAREKYDANGNEEDLYNVLFTDLYGVEKVLMNIFGSPACWQVLPAFLNYTRATITPIIKSLNRKEFVQSAKKALASSAGNMDCMTIGQIILDRGGKDVVPISEAEELFDLNEALVEALKRCEEMDAAKRCEEAPITVKNVPIDTITYDVYRKILLESMDSSGRAGSLTGRLLSEAAKACGCDVLDQLFAAEKLFADKLDSGAIAFSEQKAYKYAIESIEKFVVRSLSGELYERIVNNGIAVNTKFVPVSEYGFIDGVQRAQLIFPNTNMKSLCSSIAPKEKTAKYTEKNKLKIEVQSLIIADNDAILFDDDQLEKKLKGLLKLPTDLKKKVNVKLDKAELSEFREHVRAHLTPLHKLHLDVDITDKELLTELSEFATEKSSSKKDNVPKERLMSADVTVLVLPGDSNGEILKDYSDIASEPVRFKGSFLIEKDHRYEITNGGEKIERLSAKTREESDDVEVVLGRGRAAGVNNVGNLSNVTVQRSFKESFKNALSKVITFPKKASHKIVINIKTNKSYSMSKLCKNSKQTIAVKSVVAFVSDDLLAKEGSVEDLKKEIFELSPDLAELVDIKLTDNVDKWREANANKPSYSTLTFSADVKDKYPLGDDQGKEKRCLFTIEVSVLVLPDDLYRSEEDKKAAANSMAISYKGEFFSEDYDVPEKTVEQYADRLIVKRIESSGETSQQEGSDFHDIESISVCRPLDSFVWGYKKFKKTNIEKESDLGNTAETDNEER